MNKSDVVGGQPEPDFFKDFDHSNKVAISAAVERNDCAPELLDCLRLVQSENQNANLLVFNPFALWGYHVAELLQIPCIVAAGYHIPTSHPHWFERRFRRAYPALYTALKVSEAANAKLETDEAAPSFDVETVSWKHVTLWMWPLFAHEPHGQLRAMLGLSAVPFLSNSNTEVTLAAKAAIVELPKAPLLLYGISPSIFARPGFWPDSVKLTGFWFLPEVPNYQAPSALQRFLPDASSPSDVVYFGFGSMGAAGLVSSAVLMELSEALVAAVKKNRLRIVVMLDSLGKSSRATVK